MAYPEKSATLNRQIRRSAKVGEWRSTRIDRHEILDRFKIFEGGSGGLDSWLGPKTPDEVFEALGDLENRPLTQARLNQLLTLSHEAPISKPLFTYYWLEAPTHPYDVTKLPGYDERWVGLQQIESIDQLYWGLYRFYVDALLFFGSVRTAFQRLRQLSASELTQFFGESLFDTLGMSGRGDPLTPALIARDNRYLISEMACKSFDAASVPEGELAQVMVRLHREHLDKGGGPITARQLLTGGFERGENQTIQPQLLLSADDFLEEVISDEIGLLEKIERVALEFEKARAVALKNTQRYLSMVGDLDVYVATSMRDRNDFRSMADFCETIFSDSKLEPLKLRYFDPTLSAAANHEDKGLIECLMVKCTKVLILNAGVRDSYGKDAEAAMALSLGKPVIVYADTAERGRFFRDVHPLSRLIDFKTGVAVGAMIATSPSEVVELLWRIFNNDVEYELVQPRSRYLTLKEKTTDSVVRLQTNDELLRETFWNHYHNDIR